MSCCGGSCKPAAQAASLKPDDAESVYASVEEYYGRVLQTTKDLKTSACCTSARPHAVIRAALALVPAKVQDKYYGCGNIVPLGIEGLDVLDLGCGAGQDCYIASVLVGERGSVVGVDMTDEMLDTARGCLPEFMERAGGKAGKLLFKKGFIEHLDQAGIAPSSIDIAISNCVVNLSPDKPAVLRQVFAALRPGGEFYFSDVYADRRLPVHVRSHAVLVGECIGGALYLHDFVQLAKEVGFGDPRVIATAPIAIEDEELKNVVGNAQFFSVTFRLFKLPAGRLESQCEDYGQVATYGGGIPGMPHAYQLDDHHVFPTGKPVLVCGNTASMLQETWLGKFMAVQGNRDVHFGKFDCAPPPPASGAKATCC
mmetsp:Transcript_16950/g.43293  ORF Transcript_16950/g.43293 Transcript_16950/m.43293 type:complete len:369 (-) Transcript_16950:28-1134(-)